MAAIDDYDMDGHHDLNIGTAIYLGKGNGEFENPITLESFESGFDARSADFDGDGFRDLAIIGIGASSLVFYWGKPKEGNSFLTRQSFPIPSSAGRDLWHMDIGDFNNDELPDLAIASIGGNHHCVALNLGNRNFTFLPLRAPSLALE